MQKIFDRNVIDINGNQTDLSSLNDKVVLVVNTASKCGLTKQLAGLEELYQRYKDRGFEVIGFPSNNFGDQEPLSNPEILKYYSNEYNVTFQLTEKTDVIEGNIHPLYEELFEKTGKRPEWNFSKYLVNRGRDVVYFEPTQGVDDVVARIEAAL
jgi:glutathione peroxidase